MWLLGDHASKLLYDLGLSHNQIVAQSRVSMFELTRALTIRATYPTIEHIPEGTK